MESSHDNHKIEEENNGDSDARIGVDDGHEVKLERRLSLLDGTMINIGVIIGSGIFISPKGVLAGVDSVGATLCIWLAGGVFSVFGAICYAELGTMIPASGGTYTYVRVIFGDLWGFLSCWSLTFFSSSIANAVIALMISKYCLEPFYPDSECPPPRVAVKLIAVAAVLFITFVNCWDVKLSSRLQNVTSFTKLVALGVIIVMGVVKLANGHTENFQNPFASTNIQGLAPAFYSCLFSYAGWQSLNSVVEELKNPSRNLPIAVLVPPTVATVVNTLANVAYFTVLSSSELLRSDAVAVSFAAQALGKFSAVVYICVVLSCIGALNGCIISQSRSYFVGAREGHLPRFLVQVGIRRKTPLLCVVTSSLVTIALCYVDSIFLLINVSRFLNCFFFGLLAIGILYLRIKEPERPRSFHVTFIIPVIFLMMCSFLTGFSFWGAPMDSLIGVGIILSGIPLYYIRGRCVIRAPWVTHLYRHTIAFLQKVTFVSPERIINQ
nr:Y+L amino acid transporter 2-like [Lytechinus pictus]